MQLDLYEDNAGMIWIEDATRGRIYYIGDGGQGLLTDAAEHLLDGMLDTIADEYIYVRSPEDAETFLNSDGDAVAITYEEIANGGYCQIATASLSDGALTVTYYRTSAGTWAGGHGANEYTGLPRI